MIDRISKEGNYIYREQDGKVYLDISRGKEVKLKFGETSVAIEESYEHGDKQSSIEIIMFVKRYATKQGYEIERSNTELYGEYRLHVFLYKLGYKRCATGCCDLDYISDKRWYVNEAGKLIGSIGL